MWWGDQARADLTNQMFKLYEEKHPNIKIVGETSPFDGYFDKLNTLLASGSAPDIFALGSNIPDYVSKNVVLDLTPYVGKGLDVSNVPASLIDFNTVDGKMYGVTTGGNARAFAVNTSVLEKAGIDVPNESWTWDDFAQINGRVTQKLGKGYYGSYDPSGSYEEFETWLKQRGKVIYDNEQKKLGFQPADAAEWFQMWSDMRKSGAIVTAEEQVTSGTDASKSLITQGKVAMLVIPSNQLASYQKMTQDKLILLPYPNGPQGNGLAVQSGASIVGYAKTEHAQEVASLMDFWLNDPEAIKILGTNRGVPASTKMIDVLRADASAEDQIIYDYLDLIGKNTNVKATINIPGYNEFAQLLMTASQQVAFGKTSIQDAVNPFYEQAQKVLDINLKTAQ